MARRKNKNIEAQRRAAFVAALLVTGSVEKASRSSQISRATGYRWFNEPEIQAEIAKRRAEIVAAAINILQSTILKAVTKLAELMDCGRPAVECRAACEVVEFSLKAREQDELAARIEKLEKLVEGTR